MLELYACTIALELATSMFDRLIYFAIDMVFISRFDIAYQLHSLNGPIGYLVAIFIMRSFWGFLEPVMIFKDWNSFLNSAAVLIICLVAKNWLIRKQYVQLLETRFTSKVENLNTMIIILSELASTRPPRTAKLVRSNSSIHSSIKAIPTSSDNLAAGASHLADTITSKVKNVFAEIVENTAEEEEHEEVITRRELYQKQRHFWQSAARLNATAGRMKVITYNGVVNIHNQNQAKEFGRKLFKHLSKGGKVVITPELIRRLFEERCEIVNRDLDEKADHDLEMQKVASKPASSALYQSNGEISDLWSKAVTMFDPFSLGRISEDFCAEAVLNIYKEQRFTAASISDFGELHQSLRIGIDIVYWLVMLMVLQSTLGFDVASYLLPFVTLLLSFSFAIASLVGNVFLAMAFVFFMSPYEVGHKVQIGLVSSSVPPPLGFIKSVSLLYTVINTTKNETIKIPNHSLWNEKIYNLSETTGATHEFAIVFNINGSEGSDAEKIKLFFTRLKHFTLRESKEWKSFFLAVFSMSIPDNTIEYRVYCSHREGWGLTQGVAVAKIDYYAQIKKLREDLNLYFVKADMPVLLNSHTHAHSSEHHKHFHGHSANTSVMSSPADSPREGRERSVNVDPENPPPLPDPDMLAHRHIPAALLSDSYSTKSEGNGRRKVGSPSSKRDSDGRRKSTGKKDK
uniref:Mechanosensitive ion channel MscS domain-containing protein n=2 Tax=Spumella elongata TaxID=89044 RepID=A0A7S3HEK3_9STRA